MNVFHKYKAARGLARRFLGWMMSIIPHDSGKVLTWCYETALHLCYILDDLDHAAWVEDGGDQDGALGWLCWCGHWQADGMHCSNCGDEPPWGCDCGFCDEHRHEGYEDIEDWDDYPEDWITEDMALQTEEE